MPFQILPNYAHYLTSGGSQGITDHNDGINLSGNLYSTGNVLYNDIIGLSGTINKTVQFGISIDGNGGTVSTGIKSYIRIPTNIIISGWSIVSETSGLMVIDLWNDTYNNFPPTVADSISPSLKPTLTGIFTKNQNNSLTTWQTGITGETYIAFFVQSGSGIGHIDLSVYGRLNN